MQLNSYFYEKQLGPKHFEKIPCTLCKYPNSAKYKWILKKKGEKDYHKEVCGGCRQDPFFGIKFHETIYGKQIHKY